MKKLILMMALADMALGASAQTKGHFEVYDLGHFKLHVYYTNDALGDASYIVEGENGLVTIEQPLFKDNVAEYDAYLDKLAKSVEKRISSYHVGGTHQHEVTMPDGMPQFVKGDIYSGMMQGFAHTFGDALIDMPTGAISEVPFDATQIWAGITFEFKHGASSDFPGASILIGKKVYYTHWAPVKAHMSHLQVSSPAAIDAEITEAENSLKSGAMIFIGGHLGAADEEAVNFKINYLKTMKQLLAENSNKEAFVAAMKDKFPNLNGEEGLPDLANALYQ